MTATWLFLPRVVSGKSGLGCKGHFRELESRPMLVAARRFVVLRLFISLRVERLVSGT